MPTVLESLQSFLSARRHVAPDLIDRWTPDMETQVNVLAGDGEPVDGKRNTWTDGVNEWWNIRVPKNAKTEPEFRDYKLPWPLDVHAEAIGSTGWDWKNKRSLWVGFDFDSITGHAAGIGITDEQLEQIRTVASELPYVEVRKSTGGSGLHLYAFFGDGVSTKNHTEHQALGRAVLGYMASETGFDFAAQIDACGGNMWIWHRKAEANNGLKLIKPAERSLSENDIPPNWRDHIEVVTRRRSKVRVSTVSNDSVDAFEALASSRKIIALDESHKALINELIGSGYSTIWVSDHHLLQTHTKALQEILEDPEKRARLGLKGFFKTISEGRDPGTPNCFMFPLDRGGWKVYRFTPGIVEDPTWVQDGDNWTTCFFNRAPDLHLASQAVGGGEMPDGKGYFFETIEKASEVIKSLGYPISIPEMLQNRGTILKSNKDGRLITRVKREEYDEKPGNGWVSVRGGWWSKIFDVQTKRNKEDLSIPDNVLRSLCGSDGENVGWYIYHPEENKWTRHPKDDVRSVLKMLGKTQKEMEFILGESVQKSWKLVNIPFQPEYPGNRQWNHKAAQYRYTPSVEPGPHPHWDKVLKHCGDDLTQSIRQLEWATRSNIKTGAQYLLAWIACLLREPFEPLPYLFLFGPQNSGKSILHEAISLLITKGVVSADRALTNANDFNGELANAVLCYVEEKDISIAGAAAYNKIKDWVTSRSISIRKMRTDSYQQPNTTHWIQTANSQKACPIFPGDTRITMIWVPDLEEEIPKKVLLSHLEEEAPYFMRTLMDLTLPQVESRLRLPIVETHHKKRAESFNQTLLEQFIDEVCEEAPGEKIPFKEFYEKFIEWLPDGQKSKWSKVKIGKSMPTKYASTRGTNGRKFTQNLRLKNLGGSV